MSDIDFKKLFEEEFDNEEIQVSEDLIARTMAAIKAEENKENKPLGEQKQEKVIPINKNRKRNILKAVYGIAAALVIGVVVIAVLNQGSFSKKSEDAADRTQANSISGNYSAGRTADADMAYDESPSAVMSESAVPEAASEKEDITSDSFDMDDGASFDYENKNEYTPESPASDDQMFDVKNYTSGIIDGIKYSVQDEENLKIAERGVLDNDMQKIRLNSAYKEAIENSSEITDELYRMLKESTEDGIREYIEAVLLQDITGNVFNDEEGNPLWYSGKEYLKLYEESIE